ncbi:MAG: dTMP kinase [Armatimonadota bacterium]|nr:dTMP kinase [Armatimonadota bacterium]
MTPRRGIFITLEGPEGCGKTTQLDILAQWLRDRGLDTLTTIEPGGEPVAERIRHMLLHDDDPLMAKTELFLYLAARAQHVERVIEPALQAGRIVLCARFSDSTLAYQGYARGLDLGFIRHANLFATGGIEPDLTLVIDVPVEVGLGRQMDRNRMEAESLQFHQKVREGFLKTAEESPGRVKLIDGTGDVETVSRRIISVVEGCVGK